MPITEISAYQRDEQILNNRNSRFERSTTSTHHFNSLDSSNISNISDITGSFICSDNDMGFIKQIIFEEGNEDAAELMEDNDTAKELSFQTIERYISQGKRDSMDLITNRGVPKAHYDGIDATDFDDFCPNDSVDLTHLKWSSKYGRYNRGGQSARRKSEEEMLSDLCDIMGDDGFVLNEVNDDE
mmetsp:Transcript_16420/g.34355  ORF Transcript_16420/g.34355 Transcript_16420/m.34355 type:complete len:185 (+) Transcript_16420:44-598(+)